MTRGRMNGMLGLRFHRLRAVAFGRKDKWSKRYWRCVCDCGSITTVSENKLTAGSVKSCGCYRADPEIRALARMRVPEERRKEIARHGANSVEQRRPPYCLTVDNAAKMLCTSRDRVIELAHSGKVGSTLRGGVLRLAKCDVVLMRRRLLGFKD